MTVGSQYVNGSDANDTRPPLPNVPLPNADRLPPEIVAASFVTWRAEWKRRPEGGWKLNKVPCRDDGKDCGYNNEAFIHPFDKSLERAGRLRQRFGNHFGLGVTFHRPCDFWILDLDGELAGPETSDRMKWLCQLAPTWCEVSVSGTGLHVVYRSPWLQLADVRWRGRKAEIIGAKKFVAITGHHWPESKDRLMPAPPALIDELIASKVQKTKSENRSRKPSKSTQDVSNGSYFKPDARRIADALKQVLGADDYDTWVKIGMCLHAWDQVQGLALWCEWSSTSNKYEEAECQRKWGTFEPNGGLTIATLFQIARDNGWRYVSPSSQATGKQKCTNDASLADTPQTGAQIILTYFWDRYQPVFRCGNAIVTRDGDDVSMGVAISVSSSDLISRLAEAIDAPRYADGYAVKQQSLPTFFKRWAPVAWGDLLSLLPDEDTADLAANSPVAEVFRRLVREAMFTDLCLGDTLGDNGVTHTERRPLIRWCERFAKEGPWRDVRAKCCWTKLRRADDGRLVLQVAIRHELFAQIKADRQLQKMGSNRFARRARRYGVGESTPEQRPHGFNAIVLDQAFVEDLISELPNDDWLVVDGKEREMHART